MIHNDATEAQIRAADPLASTWLGANAGSGKTRVLTDRVARLLLGDTRPEHILCLTFTNAAASEMQNRLFKRLGEWAMLEDPALIKQLTELGEDAESLTSEFLARARTLFARAIETPGGLRIQTIHAFCASILRRFPLEAGVSPQFQEIDDRTAQLLREHILDEMANGPEAGLIADIARIASNEPLQVLAESIVGKRDGFTPPLDRAVLIQRYGLAPHQTLETLPTAVFPGDELAFLAGLVPDLKNGGVTDKKLADAITNAQSGGLSAVLALESVVLTQQGTISQRVPPTGKLRKGALAASITRLEDLYKRIEAARDTRLALEAVERDVTLHRFAGAFLRRYEETKQARGWLDFDDLITKTRNLLTDKQQAEWVLYRLDGDIDHILVDEAQDTSPAQWDVINKLAQEFTSGAGARSSIRRTLFVVGDKKQSIYSFQGADPREFDTMRSAFRDQMAATDAPLIDGQLSYSFRSSVPILRLVDKVFEGRDKAGFLPDQTHISFHDRLPGRIDLWPLIEPPEADEDEMPWDTPVDRVSPTHHNVLLAGRIAQFIDTTLKAGTAIPDRIEDGAVQSRRVHAGDFLILVRSRGALFHEILKACKALRLPIAGADKLKVMAELAVQDLRALLSFLATPEDSLSLAAALRSPLFGLDEQAIFDLAHRRTSPHLWTELRRRRDDFPTVMTVLDDLRGQLDFLRPYDLLERILIKHKGRQKIIGRLGEESEDGIDALLNQALAYEQTDIPSLTGFLHWMETDDIEIKRTVDSAGSRIRVMTIHGAKGLEAPIVILPDTHKKPSQSNKETFVHTQGSAHWRGTEKTRAVYQRSAVEEAKQAEEEERDRLLYVALTRAERWLVIAAAGTADKNAESWHDRVQATLETIGGLPHRFGFADDGPDEGLRLDHMAWPDPVAEAAAVSKTPDLSLPRIFENLAPTPVGPPASVSPSDLGGAKALPGADGDLTEIAKERGTLIHLLLETLPSLPEKDREIAARSVVGDHISADDLIKEVMNVLTARSLQPYFEDTALTEVAITAELDQFPGVPLHGVIDRLLVTADQVVAVDFKTNRTVPHSEDQVPEGLLRQMGAYHAMLAKIYPGKRIETGILWTRTATYMPLSEYRVTQALVSVHHLDGPTGDT
ncbi:double-strand break repair helicase AddA [Marivita sp. XM-24bin2]|uniref:double-strand break repair helicase AddA n=1 Tax=unclassified Marivita TaxID=2632480 RepID=UPI000D79E1DF|nr:double-strand break repair helicase AddA [Marivita sp. XM-24bin2]MCR9110167.1 double-strand break repair helicase AddA [Paracoccaceae bacterium]PWL34321.1 MAG: double-strand break repair helicase AddA [Marivita sp. XM-24bin2]